MGCRPSRTSSGRVGDSSLEYNRNFIKEQKEKKIKSRRSGKGGRRKAPVYNEFSSTSKTYTNLNSKSSKITVRLSTDGSMLEIEQFDIDLNACVDKYRAECAPVQSQLKSQHQTNTWTSGTSHWLQRCYSAPQLNSVIQRTDSCDGDSRYNEKEQYVSKATLSKPKKSKSVSEKGFLSKTDGWCDRKRSKDSKIDVTRDSANIRQDDKRLQKTGKSSISHDFTPCESDIQVLDLEREHVNLQCETDAAESVRRPHLTSALSSEQMPSCSNNDMYKGFCSKSTGSSSCFVPNCCESQIHAKRTQSSASHRDKCNVTKMKELPSSSQSHPYQNSTAYISITTSGALDTFLHKQRCEHSICLKNKSVCNSVLQYHQTDNVRIGELVGAEKSSNVCENIPCQCERDLCVTNTNILPTDYSKSLDSKSMRCLLSGIDFSRRNFVLPTQLTNGFKNGDIRSSVLQPSDPKSISTTDIMELPAHNQDRSPLICDHPLTTNVDGREPGDNFKCCNTSNLGEELVSIETTDKLMGLTEESNYGSGVPEDCIFIMQTHSSPCRANELKTDLNLRYYSNRLGQTELFDLQAECNAGKYVTSGEETDDTSPEYEESLEEGFETRFDFSNISYEKPSISSPNDVNRVADDQETSSSDFDDEEFLDALESTYV